MRESTSKEKILKKIRKGLIHKTANPFPGIDTEGLLFDVPDEPLEIQFAGNFIEAGGHFVFCENELEFIEHCIGLAEENTWKNILCVEENLQKLFDTCEFPYVKNAAQYQSHQVVITNCEYLIARTGSVMVSSVHSGRRASAFSSVHIVIAHTSQLQFDLKDAMISMKEKYGEKIPSLISVLTGPSATADIESKVIRGAHGPAEIYVFMIDDLTSAGG
jgi:L-lactate dehydrogenase complex protein LldG